MKSFFAAVGIVLCLTLAAIGFFLWPNPAFSQQIPCTNEDPSERLLAQYGERMIAYGTTEAGAVLLRVFGKSGGSWTIIITRVTPPIHCVIAAGESFDVTTPDDKPKPRGTSIRYDRP